MNDASDAVLEDRPEGGMSVRGPLTFETVVGLWSEARPRLGGGSTVVLDLGGVDRADSAGLALLVECLRAARAAGGDLRFQNVPGQLLAIARVSRLERTLFADV